MRTKKCLDGFTLIETLLAVLIVAILASIAVASYARYIERVRVLQAQTTIQVLSVKIKLYELTNQAYPVSLTTLGDDPLDPWGRKYSYMDLSGPGNPLCQPSCRVT